ncbi:sugar phosphate isomerase/epimerase family protein [Aeromicrobium sp.]|uniref:sugar phosphate isomerase/epimerase family protein n=1 Tax=Aeromicrobium sp. TaxID=1871063 RepID=UPI002FC5A7B8
MTFESNESLEMHLGLGQGLVPEDPDELTPQRASQISQLGVTRIMTHFAVAPGGLGGDRGKTLAETLDNAGLGIVQYGGFGPRLVSPDARIAAHDIGIIAEAMSSAQTVGAEAMLFGCGSHHPTFSYGPDPRNHTQETRDRLVRNLAILARHAEDAEMPVSLEAHLLTTLDTPEHVREILDAVDSPWIRANYDPVNFLGSLEAVFSSGEVAESAAATLGPRLAPSAHIKDVVVEPDLVLKISEAAPGTGVMDLPAVLRACRHLPSDATLLVEHLGVRESAAALRCVQELGAEHGVRFIS